MERLCYISHNYYRGGNKAKIDIEDILSGMGATNLGHPRTSINNKVKAFFLDLSGILQACRRMHRGDVLVLQYPLKKYFSFVCKVAHRKGVRTIAVIHDLGTFRRKRLTARQEIARLSHCDYVIASNEKMAGWLREQGLRKPLGALGLFDYVVPGIHNRHSATGERKRVVFAGALSPRKTSFFLTVSEAQQIPWDCIIYGNKEKLPGLCDNPCFIYKGVVPPEKFVEEVEGDFGLVWDGDSIYTCAGNWGEYLRWNSPHKASFYLRAGLPVIVWKEAAIAPIIEKEGVGFTIDSLSDIRKILGTLTEDEIRGMKQKAVLMAERLEEGSFLKEALKKACASLS